MSITAAKPGEYTHAMEISFTNDLGQQLAAITCIAAQQTIIQAYDARGILPPCPLCAAAL